MDHPSSPDAPTPRTRSSAAIPILALLVALTFAPFAPAEVVILAGSANSTAPFVAAALKLREQGIDLKVDSQGNTSSAIAAVGEGAAQLAAAVRPVTAEERAAYPKLRMESTPIAYQVYAVVVPEQVWRSGIHDLSREQARGIYEQSITNWKQLGGEDRPIKFLNPDPARAAWDMFATWAYGDARKAGPGEQFEKVGDSQETRLVVEFNAGALSIMSPAFVDQRGTFALGLKMDNGEVLQPTLAAARDQAYPMSRRLDLVSAERATGSILRIINFMRSPAGRAILQRHDFLPLDPEK